MVPLTASVFFQERKGEVVSNANVTYTIDDSGSMKEENRMASQASIVAFMSELMLMFAPTDKGVHLRFINKTGPGMDNIRGDALKNQLSFTPAGSTKIGNGLKDKVLNPFVYSIVDGKKTFERPVLVLTITDGIPSEEPEDTFANMMTACSQKVKAASYPPWCRFPYSNGVVIYDATDTLFQS